MWIWRGFATCDKEKIITNWLFSLFHFSMNLKPIIGNINYLERLINLFEFFGKREILDFELPYLKE